MTFHNLLTESYEKFSELEKEIAEVDSRKERGDVFEDFVYLFFDLQKDYFQIEEVYQEENIPNKYKEKLKLESTDFGVDGIILRRNGDIVAYQVKFKSDRKDSPTYRDLSTFWTESEYADHRYTVTNAYQITSRGEKKSDHSTILYDRFKELDKNFFKEMKQRAEGKEPKHEYYDPYDYQENMIENVVSGLDKNDRGKLIAACGTGKTLMSLWISERREDQRILFVAPSLALIRQTLEEWTDQAKEKFDYIGVCSDTTVTSDAEDRWDISIEEMDAPVTTDPKDIEKFLQAENKRKKVVFSTYQSLDKVAASIKDGFDLTIFDEAHRTAGTTKTQQFSLGLHDKHIPSHKRLFMTATERLVRPGTKTRAQNKGKAVFSMDDQDLYGEVMARLDFGEAIAKGVISDYKIALTVLREEELREYIEERKYVETQIESDEFETNADTLFKQLIISKCFGQLPISKMFSYHSRIDAAKEVAFGSGESETSLQDIADNTNNIGDIYVDHINGSMSSGKRRSIFDQFEVENKGLITNVNCLTEGVDVPKVDSAFFADSKKSMIDIVQASGRALRKTKGDEEDMAYLIVPILMSAEDDEQSVVEDSQFEQVYNIIQALRDQDERIESWVNEINFKTGRGKKRTREEDNSRPYTVVSHDNFDFDVFQESLEIKISESIPEPREKKFESKDFGEEDRSSDFERKMSPIGDYGLDSFKERCVDRTMKKFSNADEENPPSQVKIDHNNISHTRRLGLMQKNKDKMYELTPLGKQYYDDEIGFSELFREQLLLFDKGEDEEIRPYYSILKILEDLELMTKLEFVYGFYSMPNSSKESISQAINRIKFIRNEYPNIEKLNEANQEKVLEELNNQFGLDFSYKDVWSSRTTTYNQFLYYRKQLDCFDFVDQKSKRIKITDSDELENTLTKAESLDRSYTDKIEIDD